ncbi:MAG: hypothetical protein IPL74_22485 [Bacteroidetes bacterium]|nr:hypothetical protein [Bacteroidota bacterium]
MKDFKKTRIAARNYWLKSTKRKRYINDITFSSLECEWQNLYVSNGFHNSFYCSLGEWNSHITDILSEETYDKYDFKTPRYNQALFRYYTRLLLISSEILTDFQDFLILLTGDKQKHVRTKLSISPHNFTCQELFTFINNICKHKAGEIKKFKYHCLNHHINYIFNDSILKHTQPTVNINNIESITLVGNEKIEVPKLEDILKQIINCYSVLDNYLKSNYKNVIAQLAKFEKKT